jgi:hypothetical protein
MHFYNTYLKQLKDLQRITKENVQNRVSDLKLITNLYKINNINL